MSTLSISKDIFKNCTCNYVDKELVSSEKDLIITANDGFIFYDTYAIYSYYNGKRNDSSYLTQSKDKKTLSFHFNNITSDTSSYKIDYELIDDIIAIKPPETLSSISHLYKMSNDDMSAFNKNYFYNISRSGVPATTSLNFIHALYIMPIKLPDDIVEDKQSIHVGNTNYKPLCNILSNYKFNVDLGYITVKETYGNVYDYMGMECKLHLPFFKVINLPIEYVMNQTIHIKFRIDLYDGICYLDITSTFNNGNSVYNDSMRIVQDIPFFTQYASNLARDIKSHYFNDVRKPFIELIHNKPYSLNDISFGRETKEVSNLLNKKGFVKVQDIDLNCDATLEEQKEIVSLLNEGVIIK